MSTSVAGVAAAILGDADKVKYVPAQLDSAYDGARIG